MLSLFVRYTIEDNVTRLTPGDGERRAQSGYVPQYQTAAVLIYEGIASGDLQWIGVADRSAGTFDDVVLGYRGRVVAYQMKSTAGTDTFSLRTLLLGSENVLRKIGESRGKLASSLPTATDIHTVFITDKMPSDDDSLIDQGTQISSAAYLRAHTAFASSRSLADWLSSDKGALIRELWEFSGLDESEFEKLWRHTGFHTGAERKRLGIEFPTDAERKRIKDIAAELPRLVAHRPQQDRWSVAELLSKLGWDSAFELKHSHSFPVDALYENNAETHRALSDALHTKNSGYIGLTGPPGSGKSTLLAAGVLPSPKARVFRYLAFVPGRGQGLGRGEAIDFLGDLVRQFKREGLGRQIVPGSELHELRTQFERILQEASQQFASDGLKTVLVIDGLDHVPREERPTRSFLCEFPLPQSVPDGVVIVLGTQRLELADIPISVQQQASEAGRLIPVSPLTPATVARIAELAHLPADVLVGAVFDKSKGHPLATRYVIDNLMHIPSAEQRKTWLVDGPEYGGDIDVFYNRAWSELSKSHEATRGVQYLALVEAPISPVSLDEIIGSQGTDAVSSAAGHLLRVDSDRNWSIFHNSFRLFLRSKFEVRYGIPNEGFILQRYRELADFASRSLPQDGQRWLELRYRLRAGEFAQALQLASPEYFRSQFLDGRAADEIHSDLRFLMRAVREKRDFNALLTTIFITHELNMRVEVINDEMIDAYIALGMFDHARNLVVNGSYALSNGKGFDLIEALLDAGELARAKELFSELEPLEHLFGQKEWEGMSNRGSDSLQRWAELSLAFRVPAGVAQAIDRVQVRDLWSHMNHPKPDTQPLRLLAARGQIRRNPGLNTDDVADSLGVDAAYRPFVDYFGIEPALGSGLATVARERCERCLAQRHSLGERHLLRLTAALVELSRVEDARKLLEDIAAPTFDDEESIYDENVRSSVDEILLFASLRARLGLEQQTGKETRSHLLGLYQKRLEELGTMHGALKLRADQQPDPLPKLIHLLDFFERAEGNERPDFNRGTISRSMSRVIPVMVKAAKFYSAETLSKFSEELDKRIERNAKHLTMPMFRRAYALELYDYEGSSENAKRRIGYRPSAGYQTPFEELSELGETIVAYAEMDLFDEAKALLSHLKTDGLGVSRRAKKDPQYLLWESVFKRANEADPASRESRVRFLTRFLSGLAESEGSGAASRIVGTLLEEAAKVSPDICEAVVDVVEDCDISSWPEIVASTCLGVAAANPPFTMICSSLLGRLSIPFSESLEDRDFDRLIELAPVVDVEKVAGRLIDCIATDARAGSRILALERVIDGARRRAVAIGAAELARWKNELPDPKSGSSPEDPFFLARSLEDIIRLLKIHRSTANVYGAKQAFIRVLEWADYDDAMRLFNGERELNEDERVLEAIARTAAKQGAHSDLKVALDRLKKIAEEEGSWGGAWRSEAKLRYHRLIKELRLADRHEDVFDVFVNDCSAGRESIENLLPDLTDVLDLFGDMADWIKVWATLEEHLREFREYRMGRELPVCDRAPADPAKALSKLLIRGLTTTVSALVDCARAAIIESATETGGDLVVSELIADGIALKGDVALEVAQICWECREINTLTETIKGALPELMQSFDLGVLTIALRLARKFGVTVSLPRQSLPGIYQIEIPDEGRYSTYRTPSGFSSSSAGLFTEDYAAWTWILKDQVNIVADASGLQRSNIRIRVGQLMQELGGENLFGPAAVERQLSRLRRLSLHLAYRKLMSGAALQGLRLAVGELMRTRAIDSDAIPVLEVLTGSQPAIVPSSFPIPRPSTIPAHVVFEMFARETPNWIQAVEADLLIPQLENWVVLAGVSTFRSGFREESWVSERYYGPEVEPADELFGQLQGLPTLVVTDRLSPNFSSPSPGGVAYVMHTTPGFEVCPIALCPIVAKALGWKRDPNNAFLYRDSQGIVAARTIYWRDGGIPATEVDRGAHGHGFAIAVSSTYLSTIAPYLVGNYIARAWRRKQKHGEDIDLSVAQNDAVRPGSLGTQ